MLLMLGIILRVNYGIQLFTCNLARIFLVKDYRIVATIHKDAGTSSRSYFTFLPVITAELMPRFVSSLILLTFFLQNSDSQIIHYLLSLVVFVHPLSSQILNSPAPPSTLFHLLLFLKFLKFLTHLP